MSNMNPRILKISIELESLIKPIPRKKLLALQIGSIAKKHYEIEKTGQMHLV